MDRRFAGTLGNGPGTPGREHRAPSTEHRASAASVTEHRASSIEHRASSIGGIGHRASSIEHRASAASAAAAAAAAAGIGHRASACPYLSRWIISGLAAGTKKGPARRPGLEKMKPSRLKPRDQLFCVGCNTRSGEYRTGSGDLCPRTNGNVPRALRRSRPIYKCRYHGTCSTRLVQRSAVKNQAS